MLLQSQSCKAYKQGCLFYCKVALVKLTSKAAYVTAKSLFSSSQARLLILLQIHSCKAHEQGCLCYCKVTLVKLTSKVAYFIANLLL